MAEERWWSVPESVFLWALRRVAQGDDPDLIYLELLVNAQTEDCADGCD